MQEAFIELGLINEFFAVEKRNRRALRLDCISVQRKEERRDAQKYQRRFDGSGFQNNLPSLGPAGNKSLQGEQRPRDH